MSVFLSHRKLQCNIAPRIVGRGLLQDDTEYIRPGLVVWAEASDLGKQGGLWCAESRSSLPNLQSISDRSVVVSPERCYHCDDYTVT